jgi:hypothetical protein
MLKRFALLLVIGWFFTSVQAAGEFKHRFGDRFGDSDGLGHARGFPPAFC